MNLILDLINFSAHIDGHLTEIVKNYGVWTYLILFTVIFCETGLVLLPFLPGDSLVFVVGALGAGGIMDFKVSLILLTAAAAGGNTLNYFIGRLIGKKIINMEKPKFIKKKYIEKSNRFYKKHGGKTLILSRFLPVIRTFAPFVAGIGNMAFPKFLAYNLTGIALWVSVFMSGGYLFGNMPFVKTNFSLLILIILIISLLPAFLAFIAGKVRFAKRTADNA